MPKNIGLAVIIKVTYPHNRPGRTDTVDVLVGGNRRTTRQAHIEIAGDWISPKHVWFIIVVEITQCPGRGRNNESVVTACRKRYAIARYSHRRKANGGCTITELAI